MIKFELEIMKVGLNWKSSFRWDDAEEYVGSLIEQDVLAKKEMKEAIQRYPWELMNFGGYLKISHLEKFKERAGLSEVQKKYPKWFFDFLFIKAESKGEREWELRTRIFSWVATGDRNYDQLIESIRAQNILWDGLDEELRLKLLFRDDKLTERQLNTVALHLEQKAEELNQNQELENISNRSLNALEECSVKAYKEEIDAAYNRKMKSAIYSYKNL